jgi:hypothetical protein
MSDIIFEPDAGILKRIQEHEHAPASRRSASKGEIRPRPSHQQAPILDETKCWYRIEIRRSKIHRWGVFALEPIPARRRVIEYTGEKIDNEEHERRSGKGPLYFFTLSKDRVIDPSIGGSGAEYINHSCDGNLESFTYGGHIYLSSRRRIEAGEELTYDYHVTGDYDVPCRCGSNNCRGSLQDTRSET